MTDQWFYILFGQEFGPFRFDELQSFVILGQLAAEDQVKFGSSGQLRTVGSIGRLMVSLPQPAEIPNPAEMPVLEIEAEEVNPHRNEQTIPRVIVKPTATSVRTQAKAHKPIACPDKKPKPAPPRPVDRNPTLTKTTNSKSSAMLPKAKETIVRPKPPTPLFPVTGTPSNNVTHPVTTGPLEAPSRETSGAPVESRSDWSNSTFASQYEPPKPVYTQRYQAKKIPLSERIRLPECFNEPKFIGISAIVTLMLLVFGWGFLPKSHADDIKRYQTLRTLLDEISDTEPGAADDLSTLKERLDEAAKQIALEVKNKANANDPAKQNLLRAARDDAPRFIKAGLKLNSPAGKEFANRLEETAYALELEERPPMTAIPTLVTGVEDDD